MRSIISKVIIALVLVCLASGLLNLDSVKADNSIVLTALGTPYFQNFDSLSNTTESNALPPGWVLVETGSSENANNLYKPGYGNNPTADTYSFGPTNSTDRALGGIRGTNFEPLYGASFTNHTGGTIQSLSIAYTGEEWRLGAAGRSDKIIFELSIDATGLDGGEWIEYDGLNFVTPYTYNVGAKNGNNTSFRTEKQNTISGLSIKPGESFWIRWRDYSASGDDDGLAVDDFSLIPSGIDNPPSLTTIDPVDNAIDVALNANLSIAFSEPVSLLDGWLSLTCSNSNQHVVSVSGGPQAYVVDPNVDFVNGDFCNITIDSEKVTDLDTVDLPDVLDKDYAFSFSTIPLLDDAPTITDLFPAQNESDVSLSSILSIQFSEPVTVSSDWFSINCSLSGIHTADVSDGPQSYTITPQNQFQYDETCTLTINALKISDLDLDDPPDNLPTDFSTTFSTLANPDSVPYLQTSVPSNDTDSVLVDQVFELTFSEPVVVDSRTPILTCISGGAFGLQVTGGPTIFQVKPDRYLNYGDTCSMTIAAQYVNDLDLIDPPDAMLLDQTINFKTVDNPDVAPTITQIVPTDGATNISTTSDISLTFSEDISVTNPWAELKCSQSGEHTFATSETSPTITINPDVDFTNSESCTLTVYASQIHDQDGIEPFDQMVENYSITFSTAPLIDQPPSMIEITPPTGATNIPVDGRFSITFSEPVYLMLGWIDFSCIKGGAFSIQIEEGPIKYSIGSYVDYDFSDTCTVTLKADKIYDLDGDAPPDFMREDSTFTFSTVKSPDELAAPTVINDLTHTPYDNQTLHESLNHLIVQFSKDVLHDGTNDAADNLQNYHLLEWGDNKTFDTITCGATVVDDKLVQIDSILYDEATHKADLSINYGVNLPNGTYKLIVCGGQTIRDLSGMPLNDGADSTITFTIAITDGVDDPGSGGNTPGSGSVPDIGTNTPSSTNANTLKSTYISGTPLIPVTGFSPGKITLLTTQETAYTNAGEQWLEIPALELDTTITGVPKENGNWDVSWLGSQAGWLDGSAQLGHIGNSVLTAHVWDALNKPGPFYGLEQLEYGDKVIVHAWGDDYIYEVREVISVKPENVKAMMKHQEKSWLTLVTCQGFDEDSGEYQRRVLVRAVLMEVK